MMGKGCSLETLRIFVHSPLSLVDTKPLLSVSLDLPRVHISMFECSLLPSGAGGEVRTAANMAVVLLQRASVTTGTIKDFVSFFPEIPRGIGSFENACFLRQTERGVSFNLHSSVLSAQLLHFTPRLLTDFAGNRVNFKAAVSPDLFCFLQKHLLHLFIA